ncbi:aminotransferase class I/II-fold pyridoxal phosphate-dependent enzyme [Spirosoma soli]|uniref:Aminotransferase class I/II-fold pyridoxal phosphate-dependent enzyme n=1 Tax=Spirosoma soli TaxID=1770529 RepID=A0ABW5LYP6_9BACT
MVGLSTQPTWTAREPNLVQTPDCSISTFQMSDTYIVNQIPARTIQKDGQEYLFFSGTSYLGLSQRSEFQQLVIDAIGRYGTVFGSSRNGNLRIGVYEEAEEKLAEYVGAPAALTLSSGMMAGQAVVALLQSQNHAFVYGPNAHPAVWQGPSVTLPTLSFTDWTAQLPTQLSALKSAELAAKPVAVLVNALDAVCSSYYAFDWVENLPDDYPITLVVDDSHGLGVLNDGRGIWPQIPYKANVRLVVTASLAKAMGLPGGVVFSDADTIANLRRSAFFGACSPMPPAYLDAYLNADHLYSQGRDRLHQNLLLAEKLLLPTGLFRHATGYPVFFTEHDDLYSHLLERNIFIYSFAYPTAADRANTRIVISAFHEFDDIHKLAEGIYQYVL